MLRWVDKMTEKQGPPKEIHKIQLVDGTKYRIKRRRVCQSEGWKCEYIRVVRREVYVSRLRHCDARDLSLEHNFWRFSHFFHSIWGLHSLRNFLSCQSSLSPTCTLLRRGIWIFSCVFPYGDLVFQSFHLLTLTFTGLFVYVFIELFIYYIFLSRLF